MLAKLEYDGGRAEVQQRATNLDTLFNLNTFQIAAKQMTGLRLIRGQNVHVAKYIHRQCLGGRGIENCLGSFTLGELQRSGNCSQWGFELKKRIAAAAKAGSNAFHFGSSKQSICARRDDDRILALGIDTDHRDTGGFRTHCRHRADIHSGGCQACL